LPLAVLETVANKKFADNQTIIAVSINEAIQVKLPQKGMELNMVSNTSQF